MLLKKSSFVGLDISNGRIKIAEVKRQNDSLEVIKLASGDIPSSAIEGDMITDPVQLGWKIRNLIDEQGFKGKRVVSMVTGNNVFIQSIIMPKMKQSELRKAAAFRGMLLLPIAIEEAALDIFPFRSFADRESEKLEVFLVATKKLLIDMLDRAVKSAGLKLVAVEIEPLALHRIFDCDDGLEKWAIINMQKSRWSFSLFKSNVPILFHSMNIPAAIYENDNSLLDRQAISFNTRGPLLKSPYYSTLIDFLNQQVLLPTNHNVFNDQKSAIGELLICGERSGAEGITESLSRELGCQVKKAEYIDGLKLGRGINLGEKNEMKGDFHLAIGLASREVIDKWELKRP